ncbi:hypothetical protein GN244_ATG02164 [Phytophthora infestans]|uniref:Uncharacterized protein n=1 Tax=Phytophthora infestans TaxID=4787 RepID=A0A833SSX7_PHYIN|nr:hypothetical protein GN244_ATG02164 [Phytophthora infestans]
MNLVAEGTVKEVTVYNKGVSPKIVNFHFVSCRTSVYLSVTALVTHHDRREHPLVHQRLLQSRPIFGG